MKIIVLLCFLMFASSCSNSIFEDFDQVEYYSLITDARKIDYKQETIISKIIYGWFPANLNDQSFYSEINSSYFNKNEFSKQDVKKLKDCLRENSNFIKSATACAPTFRDILVLKKEGKTIGIAKICLDCYKFYFVGNEQHVSSEDFENYGDLEYLFLNYKSK